MSQVRSAPSHVLADISRIVRFAPAELIGRAEEMSLLNAAWDQAVRGEQGRARVLSLVALGGEGKTSLVAKWVAELSERGWPGCEAAFAWSFYSQGACEQMAASSDLFLKTALDFFGDEDDKQFAAGSAGPFEKGQRLARVVGRRRCLLILDGVEPLQFAPTSPTPGQLKDQGLAALLTGLATQSQSLCVVTTRYGISDLKGLRQKAALVVPLQRLSREAGVRLLRVLGMKGALAELEQLVNEVRGHALSLTLFGTYLNVNHGGDVAQAERLVALRIEQDFASFTGVVEQQFCDDVEKAAGLPKGTIQVVKTREGSVALLMRFRNDQDRTAFLMAALNGDERIGELRTKWQIEFLTHPEDVFESTEPRSVVSEHSTVFVFISYSHDSDEHRERVRRLSERLRADGVETILDRYVEQGSPPEGWPRWVLNGLDKARHVVCVCTKTYYRRFRGQEVPGKGKGVDWEGALMTQSLYDARSLSNKFVPVLFARNDEPYIPEPLRGQTLYVLDSEASYKTLYDALLNQSGVEPGALGALKRKHRATGQPAVFGSKASTPAAPTNPLPASTSSATAIWHQKLDFLLVEEAITADPAMKFRLKHLIDEARAKIRDLEGGLS